MLQVLLDRQNVLLEELSSRRMVLTVGDSLSTSQMTVDDLRFTFEIAAIFGFPALLRPSGVSGHKMYGPKGVGALYVRRKGPRVQLTAQMDGGGHERGMRSGTLNVPGIVGLGEACALCQAEMAEESKRMAHLRDKLRDKLQSELDETYINGTMEHRLPNSLNISFAYVEGESLLMGINDIAVSSGSACTSATLEPSYVLKALGAGDDLAHSSIRFGLGRFNTEAEVDYVAAKVIDVVKKLRDLSPLYEMAKEGIDLSKVQWAAH